MKIFQYFFFIFGILCLFSACHTHPVIEEDEDSVDFIMNAFEIDVNDHFHPTLYQLDVGMDNNSAYDIQFSEAKGTVYYHDGSIVNEARFGVPSVLLIEANSDRKYTLTLNGVDSIQNIDRIDYNFEFWIQEIAEFGYKTGSI